MAVFGEPHYFRDRWEEEDVQRAVNMLRKMKMAVSEGSFPGSVNVVDALTGRTYTLQRFELANIGFDGNVMKVINLMGPPLNPPAVRPDPLGRPDDLQEPRI